MIPFCQTDLISGWQECEFRHSPFQDKGFSANDETIVCLEYYCFMFWIVVVYMNNRLYSLSKLGVKIPFPMFSRISGIDQKRTPSSSEVSGVTGPS